MKREIEELRELLDEINTTQEAGSDEAFRRITALEEWVEIRGSED